MSLNYNLLSRGRDTWLKNGVGDTVVWRSQSFLKNFRCLAILVMLLLFNQHSWAQANAYSFASSSGTFTPLVGATATNLVATADDTMSAAFNIGFNFTYNGVVYTQVQASSNGPLLFGTGRTQSATNNLATTTATQRPGVAALWDDLQCTSGVTYQLSGSPGSQVLTVEWLNMEWNYQSGTGVISFQVKLYEGTNNIQFVYRSEATAQNPGFSGGGSVGLMGVTSTDFLSLSSLGASPTLSTTTSTNDILGKPASGQIYTFAPPAICTGTPVAGNATPAAQTVCNGSVPAAISVVGYSTGVTGISFLWEESTNGGSSWTTATGTNGTTATFTPAAFSGTPIMYRARVTCDGSGLFANSTPATVGVQAPPTTVASNVNLSPTLSGLGISWTNGNGNRSFVVVNTTNSFTDPIGSADVTSGGAAYSGGEQIVYDGTGSSVTVTGLASGTTYYVRVYSYNRCTGTPNVNYYNTSSGTNNPSSVLYMNNDDCANAITLNSCTGAPQSLAGTTTGATVDPYIDCGATGDVNSQRGVWYKYVGDNSSVTINTCNATGYDTRLTVYAGSCGSFTCAGGNDDMSAAACPTSGLRSEVVFNALSGTDYYVFVHGYQSGTNLSAVGDFVLSWTCAPLCTPASTNDECLVAETLTVGTPLASNNSCATGGVGTAYPSCAVSQFATFYDNWFTFNSGSNTALEVSLAYASPAYMGYTVYSGACGALTQVLCNVSGAAAIATLTASTDYYVRVWSTNVSERGNFTLNVKVPCLVPTNLLVSNITPTTADITWTASASASSIGYEYALTGSATPPASGTFTTDTSYDATGLTEGNLYYFHVRSSCGVGDFSPWVTKSFKYLIGDNCALAIDLASLTSPLSSTTVDASDDYDPSCNSTSATAFGPDLFYRLNVPAGWTVVMGLTASSYDSVHSMYYGSCGSETSIACADTEIIDHTWTNNTGSAQTVYWVQDAWSTGSGTFTLAWTLTPPPITITGFTPTAVCSADLDNTDVVITGTNFGAVTDVQLNGVSILDFDIDSSTQITAHLTAGATTGTISIYNADTSATSDDTFTVNASPVVAPITAPGGATNICLPDMLTLSDATPTGVWTSSNIDAATVDASGVVSSVAVGSTTITYTVTDGLSGCSTSQTYDLTISEPVSIVSSTPSQSVVTNGTTTFEVEATGTGNPALTYQWYEDPTGTADPGAFVAITDGGMYSGANTATLQLSNIPAEYFGYFYYATVTGICNSADSSPAILLVGDTGIETNPDDASVCTSGPGTASFTVVASEDVTTYQWQEDQGGDNWMDLSNGGMYAGVDTPTLSLSGITLANNGWRYKCIVIGIGAAESTPATLNVYQAPSITTDPIAQTVCYTGGTANFSVAATGGVSGYSWQYFNGTTWNAVVNGTPVGVSYAGAATTSLAVTTTASTPAAGTYLYRAVVNAAAPCTDVPSASAQLMINNPTITAQPVAASVFAGNATSFSVTATTAMTASYQWQYATTASGPWNNVVNNTPANITYTGGTAATLNVSSTSAASAGTANYYRVVVSSGVGCSVTSAAAQLTVVNYCIPAAATNVNSYFNSFSTSGGLTNINNTSAFSTGGYGSYLNLEASQYQGESVSFTTGLTGTTVGVAVFVDWNHDGDFTDAGEVVSNTTGYVSAFSGSFTVPATATPGVTRMRIYMDFNRSNPSNFPCGPFSSGRGEMEDYSFNVLVKPACSGAPTAGTIAASAASVCVSGSVTLTATGYSNDVVGLTYQWYNTAGPIPSATDVTYVTPVLTAPETYYFRVTCTNGGAFSETASVTIGVNNPSVTGTTAATRCGEGTVVLSATGSAGTDLNWYASATGGTPLFTGSSFTTPSITATTTYYVEASVGGSTFNGARPAPASTTNTTPSSYGLVFDVTTAFTLNSVDVYNASSAGTMVLQLQSSTGSVLMTSGTFNVPAGTGTTAYTAALGWNIPVGTGYRLLVTSGTASMVRESAIGGFPYAIGTAGSITSGYISGTSTTYYYLYNWSVTTGCSSARTAVTATVTTPPALTLNPANATICNGSSSGLVTLSSNVADYDTYVWSPATGVSGNAATGYTFNPTATTTYTLTASQTSGSLCSNSTNFTVTVNPLPSAATIVPANPTVCSTDGATLLSVSGGSTSTTAQSGTGTATTTAATTGSGLGPNPLQNYYGGTKQQWLYTASELTALGFTANVSISSIAIELAAANGTALQNVVIKMKNTSKTSFPATAGANWDTGLTEVKSAASHIPVVGWNTFALTTPFVWDGTSNLTVEMTYSNNNGGNGSTNTATYSTTAFSSTMFYRVDNQTAATVSNYTGTATAVYSTRNNVQFVFGKSGNVVWSSSEPNSLYADAAATVAYNGLPSATVYAKPLNTATITAAITSQDGCAGTPAQTVLTVTNATTWYVDNDSDGYGDSALPTVMACSQPTGYAAVGGDCNDAVAAINPGHAEVLYNGVDDNCDGQLDEGNQLVTSLLPASCGTTLTSIGSLVGITTVSSAITGYRIRITNGAQVQVIEKNVPHFTFPEFPSYAYATTYTVEIELQRNGVWLGYYGPACLVSTPAILEEGGASAVSPSQCGITLPKINTLIATTSLQGVTGYRFQVTNLTDPLGPNAVQTIDRTQNWFSLPMLTRYNYGTTYRIEIAVKTTGAYGGFGAPCEVSSPPAPSLINCGGIAASGTSTVAATSVQGATQYRFQITRQSDLASATIDRNSNYFIFNSVPASAFTPGALYGIRVAVMTSGFWSPFGDACEYTAPGGASKGEGSDAAAVASEFRATAYPNPFTSDFGIDVTSSNPDNVQVRVYDMLGKLIEDRSVRLQDLSLEKVGAQYPSGVYNVIVTQGEIVKTLRVIKR